MQVYEPYQPSEGSYTYTYIYIHINHVYKYIFIYIYILHLVNVPLDTTLPYMDPLAFSYQSSACQEKSGKLSFEEFSKVL